MLPLTCASIAVSESMHSYATSTYGTPREDFSFSPATPRTAAAFSPQRSEGSTTRLEQQNKTTGIYCIVSDAFSPQRSEGSTTTTRGACPPAYKSAAELMCPRSSLSQFLSISLLYQSGVDFKCPFSNLPLKPLTRLIGYGRIRLVVHRISKPPLLT